VELDHLLRTTWRHPRGGKIGIAAAAIDSGNWTQNTYDFVGPLDPKRRVMAVKGVAGASQVVIHRSQHKYGMSVRNRGGCWLWLVGVDGVKNILFARLQRGDKVRFSDSLQAAYFEELAAEKVQIRYRRGKIERRYEKVSDRARNEALDCLVYSFAAMRSIDAPNWDRRQEELSQEAPVGRPARPSIVSQLAEYNTRR
jgi:phage terminase large subunit GpA-like protein